MAEEVKKEEPKAASTKSYKLKEGVEHFTIERGNLTRVVGPAKVNLTEDQAMAFKDKIEGGPTEPDPNEVSLTITEANAAAGLREGLESDTSPADEKSDADEKASAPAPAGTPSAAGETPAESAKATPVKK